MKFYKGSNEMQIKFSVHSVNSTRLDDVLSLCHKNKHVYFVSNMVFVEHVFDYNYIANETSLSL